MQDFSGYKKEQLTIDLAKANVYAIVLIIPIVLVFGLPFRFVPMFCLVFS